MSTVDLRSLLPCVKDQGPRSTCVSFAMTAGHEVLHSDGVDLSEEFLHWAAKQRDGLGLQVDGTTLSAAAAALHDIGQPPEAIWPYSVSHDHTSPAYVPPTGAFRHTRSHRLTADCSVSPTSDAIHRALDSLEIVVLAVRLFSSWYQPTTEGHILLPPASASALGAHAVLVVGYDEPTNGEKLFLIRNSWGASWALAGYGYLPYSYVDAYGIGSWSLGLAPDLHI
jgi:Papain family cysteine protease